MKRMNLRKALNAGLLISGMIIAASATADQPQGGYGMGSGMMGEHSTDSGMMAGSGMGSGMMGGHGMGSGMMDGCGMDPGAMGGYGMQSNLGSYSNLSTEQRGKIAKIRDDARHKQWALMGKIQDEQAQMNEQYYSDNHDDAALSKSYRTISDLRYQMFEGSLNTRKQIEAILTKEQREKQKHGG